MSLLELRAVCAYYGPVRAVEDVTLSVAEGEAVGLLGANGAGKTTTLRAITGMLRTTGDILFDGVSLRGRRPDQVQALGVAHVPEGRGTLTDLTVRENLMVGAYRRRRDRSGVAHDIEYMLELFPQLAQRIDSTSAALSGGEQQMLAIARAYLARPRLLLLDEASLGLAPATAADVYRAIERLRQESGLSMLLVEQNSVLAFSVVERAYILELGRVALSGTSDDLAGIDDIRRAYLGG